MSSTRTPLEGPERGRPEATLGGDPATRRRICEAALRLITERGGVDVPLASVAREAGVSRQALYLHFANRADLIMGVVRFADEQRGVPEAVARVKAAPSAVEAIELMVAMQADMNPSVWPLARIVESVRHGDPAAEASWKERMAERLEGCRAIARRLDAEGLLRVADPEVAADVLWTLTSLRTWEDLVLTRGWTDAEYRARVTELLLSSLVAGRDRP